MFWGRAWEYEIGERAALHAESLPRDIRWWRGLAEKAGWVWRAT